MGCISSKIMTKSASFREELNRSMRKRTNGIEEIIVTKNSSEQFVAILCAANTVARKLKEGSPLQEPNGFKDSSVFGSDDVETINTWELLAGLEEGHDQCRTITSDDSVGPSRSFRTVEDFDAMMAANQAQERPDRLTKRDEDIKQEAKESEEPKPETMATCGKGSRRKAMGNELAALNVPSFEFARTGSLREWLLQGGQVYSPGSYVTPKFGNVLSPGANSGENNCAIVFDPELIHQFEQAMEQLTKEEESILDEIVGSLEGDGEGCISRTETSEKSEERPVFAEVS